MGKFKELWQKLMERKYYKELETPSYPEKATDYLDEKFPKGDKRRGEAMSLLAVAYLEGKEKRE